MGKLGISVGKASGQINEPGQLCHTFIMKLFKIIKSCELWFFFSITDIESWDHTLLNDISGIFGNIIKKLLPHNNLILLSVTLQTFIS